MNGNEISLVGNLTREPELRYTQGGTAVCNFSVAAGRRYQQNGEWQEQTTYFEVVAWGELGENIAASFTKGTRALVTGRIESEKYTDRDGNERTSWKVTADEVGVSLRWARATIEKVRREQTGTPPAAAAANAPSPRTDPVYGGEEPF